MNISLHKETNEIYTKSQNTIITMEELSELIEQLSVKNKKRNLIAEEVCDVIICLKRIELMLKIRLRDNMNVSYINNYNCIVTLSKMQKSLSKLFRNKFVYNREFIKNMESTKAVLRSIIRAYDIEQEVEEWIQIKEKRTRYRIDNKILK